LATDSRPARASNARTVSKEPNLLIIRTASVVLFGSTTGGPALEGIGSVAQGLAFRIWRQTLRIPITAACAIFVLLLMSIAPAPARPLHVLTSTPAAEAIIRGGHAQYAVRFDGPVDHAQARLEILRDGQVVQRLNPLLDSAADVLFASAPAPEPGHYTLHWVVKSVPDEDVSDGTIPFSVAH